MHPWWIDRRASTVTEATSDQYGSGDRFSDGGHSSYGSEPLSRRDRSPGGSAMPRRRSRGRDEGGEAERDLRSTPVGAQEGMD